MNGEGKGGAYVRGQAVLSLSKEQHNTQKKKLYFGWKTE